jgi:hypothetical protein
MNRAIIIAAGLALAALLSGAALAQTPQFVPRTESPEEFPAGPGRDDTFYACTACHNFKLVAAQGLSRQGWEESLQFMYDKHKMPVLPPKEREVVLNYLTASFPPRAPANRGTWQSPFAPR